MKQVWAQYNGPFGKGAPLWVPEESLEYLGWHNIKFINITNQTFDDFIMVTGATWDHFEESLDLIGSVHAHFPNHKMIYYDLGLGYFQRLQVSIITFSEIEMENESYHGYNYIVLCLKLTTCGS